MNKTQSLHPSTVGIATQYLSEVMLGEKKDDIFRVSLQGAHNLGLVNSFNIYLKSIQGLDDESIINASRLECTSCDKKY